MTRRHVRLTTTWFASLSEELPEHRTASRPSRWDFTARELPGILERVAEQWETLVEFIPGRLEYRDLDGTSDLGLAYRAECLLTQAGIVEVIGVEVDTAPPWIAEEFATDL